MYDKDDQGRDFSARKDGGPLLKSQFSIQGDYPSFSCQKSGDLILTVAIWSTKAGGIGTWSTSAVTPHEKVVVACSY
jgi:hypothetical protein